MPFRKKEESKSTESTGLYYNYRTRGGVTSGHGEDVYEKRRREIDTAAEILRVATGVEDKKNKLDPIKVAKEECSLPSDIDLIIPTLDPKNLYFVLHASSYEEARKKIVDYQSNFEKARGIKINLEELKIEERS